MKNNTICVCKHAGPSPHIHMLSIMGDTGGLDFPVSPIALVGSSARILDSNHGEKIDQYKEVVRFNRAPIGGYEEHVGSKTTLRIANNHVFNNNDVEKDEGVWGDQPKDFIRDLRNQRILYCADDLAPWWNRQQNTHESNQLFVVDYPIVEYMRHTLGVKWEGHLTIGAVFIFLALTSGLGPVDEMGEAPGQPLLHLYGFDILEDVKRTHYWEQRPEPQGKSHSISTEKNWLIHLIQNNLIKYF